MEVKILITSMILLNDILFITFSAFTIGNKQSLDDVNPKFTMRREMERVREEMEQLEQLRRIIESRLKVTLPDDLPAALMDGVVLCHLANHVRPHAISSIHVPSPAVPKLSLAKCRRNVESFVDASTYCGKSTIIWGILYPRKLEYLLLNCISIEKKV
ncbi:leucine-rich repeat and calponin homology domain-containing protein 1-like [Saccoglossus kowalevskii]